MTMCRLVFILAWLISMAQSDEECGGVLSGDKGILQTPNFPNKFKVPIRCHWVIDASQLADNQDTSIVVYFTQLFVSSGLSFTEFDYYEADSTFQLGGRLIHKVTEQNITNVQWLLTRRQYLVVDFILERLEGNHLRVLDDLLDVYGFNITYEARSEVRSNSCSVVGCSLAGHCYVSDDYKDYWCSCFPGFSGPNCGLGPLCQPANNLCENGATCRQAGATAVICNCPEGFTGSKCDVVLPDQEGCLDTDGCTTQCPDDGSSEPCACGPQGMPVTHDRARYEGTVRLTNVSAVRQCLESATCTLKPMLGKQISKYLRSSNLSVMEDLRVIDVGFSGEVRFHFWGGKRDGSKVRESLNRLVQRGRLGNVTLVPTHLAITQEPTLLLQSVRLNQAKNVVRQGDEFILSCFAQGSSHMTFRWFKDGVFVNVTKSRRNIWTRLLPLDSAEQYTALLGVEHADPLDQGRYTCQVTDWGYQQCKSLVLEVMEAPQVKLEPMSITVEKGENVTVKCTSPNELQYENRFGYSWTKNNALFKMSPSHEFWEDLYPGGSILRIANVQKSATYTCHVHGSVASVSKSVRLEMLNRSVVPWCAADESGVGGVRWDKAGPGVVARVECPAQYSGVATRLCLLVDKGQARWQTPDFSDCVSDKLANIANNFNKVTLGYGNTTALEAISGVLTSLRDRGVIYPGEGEPAITLLHKVVTYLNETTAWDELVNTTTFFYSSVNTLLQHRNSIINHQKVEELQQIVNQWSMLWGSQSGTSSAHLAFDSLVVDMFRYEATSLRNSVTLHIPRPTHSYPPWFTSRVALHMDGDHVGQNTSSSVAVITYNRLSEFLPQRYSQMLENGSEVQYEIASDIVGVVVRGPLHVVSEVELLWSGKPGWELRCGVSHMPSSAWNVSLCHSTPQSSNHTLCHCPQLGTYAAIVVKVISTQDHSPKPVSPRIVLVGCVCCLVQSLLTFVLLLLRWWRHRTCLLFLKLQCCTATAAAMLVFLYATSRTLSQDSYPAVCTSLQAIILVSLSSHLSKVLLVYTEIIYLPNLKHVKENVMVTMTGAPLLLVLCNHIALSTLDSKMVSWWLVQGTMVFYTCVTCGFLFIVLFVFLYFHVSKRLKSLAATKNSDTKKAIIRRMGLLNRAAILFNATVVMAAASLMYINIPSTKCQYMFSFTCALLGFVLLLCYILHCESPLHLHVLRTLKLENSGDQGYSSESDSSPLSIFTKQEAEAECEAAPPRCEPVDESGKDSQPQNAKTESTSEAEVESSGNKKDCDTASKEKTATLMKTNNKPKAVTFHNDLVTGCDKGVSEESVDMEVYPSSPRKFTHKDSLEGQSEGQQYLHFPPPDGGTARVCVITSVVVDTPSVVVCSVDVEPCSVLNQSIVTSRPQGESTPTLSIQTKEAISESVAVQTPDKVSNSAAADGDVMDRICHDLDYLLNGLPIDYIKPAEFPTRPGEEDIQLNNLIHQTSL